MIIILGLGLGIGLGLVLNIQIPDIYSTYLTVTILACLDAIMGGYRAYLQTKFDGLIFITGFLGSALIALGLTYMGNVLSHPIYLVGMLVFGYRIFSNFSRIRRLLLEEYRKGLNYEKIR